MEKVNSKDLNKKNTWIVAELHHERYTFDIEVSTFKNKTILDILDIFCYDGLEKRIEKYQNKEIYILDEIYHEDKNSDTWCLTEKEKERFLPLHIGGLIIMPLKKFLKEGYMTGCFGCTNRKYGIMDYAKVPVEMEEEKDAN